MNDAIIAQAAVWAIPLLITILGFFIRHYAVSIKESIDQVQKDVREIDRTVTANHVEVRERLHDVRNAMNGVQGTLMADIDGLEEKIEKNSSRIEQRHQENQTNVLAYKTDIATLNSRIAQVLQQNIDILDQSKDKTGKIIFLEEYVKANRKDVNDLSNRVDSLEREVRRQRS